MVAMLAFFLNLPLAVVAGAWLSLAGSVPGTLGIICVVFGGFNVLARLIAWFGNGAAIRGFTFAMQESGPLQGFIKMLFLEFAIWGASLVNIFVFLRLVGTL